MKIRRFLFVISAMLLMVQGASAWSGSGTSSGDPYLIASPADWETLATSNDDYSGKFFKLTADITIQIAHSRGDRFLSHSSRHTQVPVPATTEGAAL